MAIPTKKMYDRKGKLIFDPNNPEDVKNYRKIQPLIESFNLVRGLTDPRGGGGLFGMARKAASKVVSKAIAKETVKKAAKSTTKRSSKKVTTTENKVEKPNLTLENLKKALNPSSELPSSLPKVGNNKSLSTSNKSLTSNTFKSRTSQKTLPAGEESKTVIKTDTPKIKTISDFMKQQSEVITPLLPNVKTFPSGSKNISNTMELAQIPSSSVKTIKEGIKSFKGTKGKFTPRDTERVAKAREILNQPIAGTMRPSTISQGFKSPFANTSLRKYIPEANPYDFSKFKLDGDVVNKPLSNLIEGSMIVGGLGLGAGLMSYDSRLNSSKVNNKQTTSPVDLKRIDRSKLRDSNIEGVKTIKGSDGKDYGIKWNNTTGKWEYYKGGGKPVVKQTTPKQETVKENTGGGGVTPIKDNKKTTGTGGGNQTTTTGGTGSTKATTTPTVTPTTSTYVGDEYYKANPDLEKAIQDDSIKQQRAMYLEKIATKPLSSLVFKTTSKDIDVRNTMDEQNALKSIRENNKLPLKKKRYGGNLAMLKYMK